MIKHIRQSLANKIVLSALIGILGIIVIIFIVLTKIASDALYESELEKARLISKTYTPLLAINILLDRTKEIDTLSQQLIDNDNIISVKIFADNHIIKNISSSAHNKNTFSVSESIIQPNSSTKLGKLEIFYSNRHYTETLETYYFFISAISFVLLFLVVLFGFYVRYLLSPLKEMRILLKNFTPDQRYTFSHTDRIDEVGLISSAFNAMQIKIVEYSQMQLNINENLANKVQIKTEELRHKLYFDDLTNLHNRTSLIQSIIGANQGVLIIINIDDFKEINDFFGHLSGDKLLQDLASMLEKYLQAYPTLRLYRLNGDEFAILHDIDITAEALEEHIIMLIHNIESIKFDLEDNEIEIRVTIGASLQMKKAFEKADMALQKARTVKQPYLLYDEKYFIETQYKEKREWTAKIKYAIANDQILPFYQPIFDNQSGKIVSYEALMRIQESDGTIITPNNFLEIATRARLYPELTKIMIEKSCLHFSKLETSFSINLTFKDMTNTKITNYLIKQIDFHHVEKKIIFEILESEEIADYTEIEKFIQKMRALGCRFAIDDFGSGYSNYEHLLKLHIDYIKIDGSLIKDIDSDANAKIIVQTVIKFAKELNIETVAEFVHSEAVYKHVKELGINRSQGFFLGKPQKNTL